MTKDVIYKKKIVNNRGVFYVCDRYANAKDYDVMESDQLGKWKMNHDKKTNPPKTMFLLSWTLTGKTSSIKGLSEIANPKLKEILDTYVPKYDKCNIVYLDYITEELCSEIIKWNK